MQMKCKTSVCLLTAGIPLICHKGRTKRPALATDAHRELWYDGNTRLYLVKQWLQCAVQHVQKGGGPVMKAVVTKRIPALISEESAPAESSQQSESESAVVTVSWNNPVGGRPSVTSHQIHKEMSRSEHRADCMQEAQSSLHLTTFAVQHAEYPRK